MIASPRNDPETLGPCCICGQDSRRMVRVRNIIMLSLKCPTPGRGWGCVVCHLPNDGAIAVVCDQCVSEHGDATPLKLVYACRGFPGRDGRAPIAELAGTHEHDMALHSPGD